MKRRLIPLTALELPQKVHFTGAMPNPYDVAVRERAVKAYKSGEGSCSQLAALLDLDMRTLERWLARWRETWSVAPKPRGGWWRCPIDMVVLHAVVREGSDATVDELCWAYNRRVGRAQKTTRTRSRRAMPRAGQTFALDASLIKRVNSSRFSDIAKRPPNTTLSAKRMETELGVPALRLEDRLKSMKALMRVSA